VRRESLFHSNRSPKQDLDGHRARALGLVSRAVKQIGPSVVRLETETYLDQLGDEGQDRAKLERHHDHVSNDDENWGDVFDGLPETPQKIDFGQGSGIIINSDGYILTNAHVVEGADNVFVRLTDGRRFRAKTQGSDEIIDIALLKILPELDNDNLDNNKHEIGNLPVAELGNSDDIQVGNFVLAIGTPRGLDGSCTLGIVSGLKRCPKVSTSPAANYVTH
jgi:S1-C subfamily serine protease